VPAAREAYAVVANKLREMITNGDLGPGERLPRESELCELFSVSRSTVREAIRSLSSEHLVEIVRGAGGGTFVGTPKIADVSQAMAAMFGLVVGSDQCTVDELVDTRRVLEIHAARGAAIHRTADDIAALRASLPSDGSRARLSASRAWDSNYGFHLALLSAAGNRVVQALALPVFTTLHHRVSRETKKFPSDRVVAEHRDLLAAIEQGDADEAARLMSSHLDGLVPVYASLEKPL
jgi:DNA-binding FadR family transcriptional regulator